MIFSDSEVTELQDILAKIKVSPKDAFGIVTLSMYGNFNNHFLTWCQWNTADDEDIVKNYDKLIIKYFTKTSCKNYIHNIPIHIKNKIIANSL